MLRQRLTSIQFSIFISSDVFSYWLSFLAHLLLEVECFVLHAGSKEENFYDSQPWLESDCEDDFFSVNGGKDGCLSCFVLQAYCNFNFDYSFFF